MSIDYEGLGGMSHEAVRKATDRDWEEWTRFLDGRGAAALEHAAIAQLVLEEGVSAWWSQTVTVAYERFRGLREPGQRRGGGFDMNRSKTFPVPVDRLWSAWRDDSMRRHFVDLELELRTESENRSLRFRHPLEGTIALWFTDKGEKSAVQVQVEGFETREEMESVKETWSERLARLGEVLAGG